MAEGESRRRWCCRRALALVALVAASLAAGTLAAGLSSVPDHVGYSQFLLFPTKGGSMGVFLALSVPLDSIHHDVSVAYNFEANYALPTNATELTELQSEYGFRRSQRSASDQPRLDGVDGHHPGALDDHPGELGGVGGHPGGLDGHPGDGPARPRSLRDVGRAEIYAMVMGSIARAGLPGRACLLRAVCEVAEWPLAEGLMGNLLTVLLQPSSSTDDDVHPSFHEAERRGRRGADCALGYADCPVSLLGLLTEHQE